MTTEVFAKSTGETVGEHTQNLLTNYQALKADIGHLKSDFFSRYDEVVQKILEYHDLGKLNYKFQSKMRRLQKISPPEKPEKLEYCEEIPHGWLSLAFITDEDRDFFDGFDSEEIYMDDLVMYCVAFHHNRNKIFSKEAYQKFVELDLEKNKYKLGIDYELNPNINIDDVRQKVDSEEYFENYFELLVFLKGLLHKCDYSASGGIKAEKPYAGDYRQDFENWLKKEEFTLRQFQKEARQVADKSVVLTASTGIGKTEYSMNWINGDKAFYLLGIRTAVNKMRERFTETFNKDNVSLLHGETAYLLAEKTNKDGYDSYFQKLSRIRQFCFPITVATADQLVTAAFKYNGFELIYLTASYSKIVVDEIQSFSPEAIAVIVVFLQEIHKLGGKFLLMTATLPPFIKKEFESLGSITFPEPVLSDLKRHRLKCVDEELGGETTLEKIRDGTDKGKKILVVVNTVRKAQELYEMLKEDFKPKLLHARFIRKDRKIKEDEIMEAAKGEAPCLWIATQIVEASLDIDFDLLITECSTVDSIFQRFGRCYRKRELKNAEPNIYIFKYDKATTNIYDGEITERSWNALNEYDGKLVDESDKQEIINEVFSNLKGTQYLKQYDDYKGLLKLGYRAKNKKDAQKLFRKISNSHLVVPEPVYKENRSVIDALINDIDNDRDLKTVEKIKKKGELLDWTISLQVYDAKLLEPLIFDSNICKQMNLKLIKGTEYNPEQGMNFIKNYKDYSNFI